MNLKEENTKYDYAILGLWYGNNYGAALTSYALYQLVCKMGASAVLIDVPDYVFCKQNYRNDSSPVRKFITKYCNVTKKYRSQLEIRELNQICNSFLIGSDSIWYTFYNMRLDELLFRICDFADDGKKIVSYATSFGKKGIDLSMPRKKLMEQAFRRFGKITVREASAIETLKKEFNIDAFMALDPVFLLDKSLFDNLMMTEKNKIETCSENYIFAYILQPTNNKIRILNYIVETINLPVVIVGDLDDDYCKYEGTIEWKNRFNVKKCSIEQWIYYLKNARFVVTDSYHGYCFSIIFNKQFFILKPRDAMTRFNNLSEISGTHRLIRGNHFKEDFQRLKSDEVDYEMVMENLLPHKEKSKDLLRQILGEDNLETDRKVLDPNLEIKIDGIHDLLIDNIEAIDQINCRSDNIEFLIRHIGTDIEKIRERTIGLQKAYVKKILLDRLKEKKVAIKGGGKHTVEVMKLLPKDSINFVCVMTRDGVSYIDSLPNIQDNEIKKYKIDVVLISSFKYRAEMKSDIMELKMKLEVIDIYEELKKDGIELKNDFFYF